MGLEPSGGQTKGKGIWESLEEVDMDRFLNGPDCAELSALILKGPGVRF